MCLPPTEVIRGSIHGRQKHALRAQLPLVACPAVTCGSPLPFGRATFAVQLQNATFVPSRVHRYKSPESFPHVMERAGPASVRGAAGLSPGPWPRPNVIAIFAFFDEALSKIASLAHCYQPSFLSCFCC